MSYQPPGSGHYRNLINTDHVTHQYYNQFEPVPHPFAAPPSQQPHSHHVQYNSMRAVDVLPTQYHQNPYAGNMMNQPEYYYNGLSYASPASTAQPSQSYPSYMMPMSMTGTSSYTDVIYPSQQQQQVEQGINIRQSYAPPQQMHYNLQVQQNILPAFKNEPKLPEIGQSLRVRKKRSFTVAEETEQSQTDEEKNKRVFVWNLDGTLLPNLVSAHNGTLSESDVGGILRGMNDMISHVGKEYLHANDLERYDQITVSDGIDEFLIQLIDPESRGLYDFKNDKLAQSEIAGDSRELRKKISLRYDAVSRFYNRSRMDFADLLPLEMQKCLCSLLNRINSASNHWLEKSVECIKFIKSRPLNTNVIITNGSLVRTVAKLLVFGLSEYFEIGAIYSSSKIGSHSCFERIQQDMGKDALFMVIGGVDEHNTSKSIHWPHFPVQAEADLMTIRSLLELDYL